MKTFIKHKNKQSKQSNLKMGDIFKSGKIKFIVVLSCLFILSFSVLSFMLVKSDEPTTKISQVKDYDGNLVYKNQSYVYLRTAEKEIIKNPDGTYSTTIGGPKLIDDKTKPWANYVAWNENFSQIIDSDKVGYDKMLDSTYSQFKVYFKNNTNTAEAVRFEKDGYFFVYDISGGAMEWAEQPGFPARTDTLGSGVPSNSKDTKIVNKSNIAIYPNGFSNTNVTYELKQDMLKETFILTGLPSIKAYDYLRYSGNVKFNASLDVCANGVCYRPKGTEDDFYTQGRIDFRDSNGTTHFYLKEPVIYDSANNSVIGKYRFKGSNAQGQFYIYVPKKFLQTAVYPVFIDPTIELQDADTENLKDASVRNSSADTNYDITSLYIGNYLNEVGRAYLQFDLSDFVGITFNVTASTLKVKNIDGAFNGNMSLYYLLNDWTNGTGSNILTETQITWNNQPCGTGFTNSTNCNLTSVNTTYFSAGSQPIINVLPTISSYILSSKRNISFIFKAQDESISSSSNAVSLASSENSNPLFLPTLSITYTPYILILSPTPSQIFTQDAPTAIFNISTATNMDTCYYNLGDGVNRTMGKTNATYFNITNTSMIDGANNVTFYCNETSGGAWRTSELINFQVDSVNITRCRGLHTARQYELINDINQTTGGDCISFDYIANIKLNGNFYKINCTADVIFANDAVVDFYGATYGSSVTNLSIYSYQTMRALRVGSQQSGQSVGFSLENLYLFGSSTNVNRPTFEVRTLSSPGFMKNITVIASKNTALVGPFAMSVVDSGNLYINNSNLYNFSGYYFESTTFARDSLWYNLSTSANTELVNVTTYQEVSSANITKKWYLSTLVNSSSGNVSGATVNVYDLTGTLVVSALTNSTGQIARQELTEYINQDGVIVLKTPHTINISATGYITNSTIYNLSVVNNTNHIVTLLASNQAPTVTLISPSNASYSKSATNTLTCNQTDSDGNLKNSTLYLWLGNTLESTQTLNRTGTNNQTVYTNYGFASQGVYNWNCYACDNQSSCAFASQNYTMTVDTTNPKISITSPANNSNTTNTGLVINYTVSDTYLQTCKWTKNGGVTNTTITCGTNITGQTWTEGLNNITVYANDSAGNTNSSSVVFRLDTITPALTIIYPTAINYSVNVSQLNYSVSDASLTSCWYNVGGANISVTCGTNLSGLTSNQGSNTWKVYANDSVGHLNSTSVTFFKDTVYPLISYSTGTENTNTNFSRNWIYINTSVTETNFKNITFRLYNDTGIYSTQTYTTATYFYNFTSLPNANYTYQVNITDIVGNTNSTELRRIILDNTAPVVTITYPLDGASYGDSNISINSTVTDNFIGVSSCWWTNNSGVTNNSMTCGQTFWQNLSDGVYTYTIYANDSFSNRGSHTHTFGISTTSPAIVLNYPSNNAWLNTNNVYFNYTAVDSDGISSCELWGNWSGWAKNYTWISPTSGVMNFTNISLLAGSYKWNIWCNDTLGNGDFTPSNKTFSVDATNPLISYGLNTPIDYANLSQSYIFVNVSVTEINLANITFNLLDGTGPINTTTSTSTSINWTGLANGNYTYFVNITDLAGNTNSTAVRTITLDNEVPGVILNTPTNNTYHNTNQNFTANLTDNLGIKNSSLYINGVLNATTTFASGVVTSTIGSVVALVDGIYTWFYNIFDWAGNNAVTTNNTVIIDKTNPSVKSDGFSPSIVYVGNNTYIYANISDTNLELVWIQINYSGSNQNITVTNHSGIQYTYTLDSSLLTNFRNITWKWFANDSASNVNSSAVNSVITTNRNPYNVTILTSNATYINSASYLISFTASDLDGDTINYSIWQSNDSVIYTNQGYTTDTTFNLTGLNNTDGAHNYYYVIANDSVLANQSSTFELISDTITPSATIILPEASPSIQCSLTGIVLNYTVNESNIDYCSFNVTSGGLLTTPNTNVSGCLNTTFDNSLDFSTPILSLTAYDLAGNSYTITQLIRLNTGHSTCKTTTPPTTGGGGTTIVTGEDLFCGDKICSNGRGNTSNRGETFYNCPEDCAEQFTVPNLDELVFNCFEPAKQQQCVWVSNPGLFFLFIFIAFLFIISLLFEFKPNNTGVRKWVYTGFKKRRR